MPEHLMYQLFSFSDHRLPFQSDDFDDGVTTDFAYNSPADDERSRDEERNGKHEFK